VRVIQPTTRRRLAPAAWAASLPVVLALSGCAAYHVGTESLYPSHIETVYVPVFESDSFRRDFGERLTEAVIREIELKTPYKVVSSPNADSVLTAHILDEGKLVVAEDYYDDPRQVQVNLHVQVDWIDRRGQMLRSSQPIDVPSCDTIVAGSSDLTAEMGQTVVTAQQQAIQRTAEQIVSMMETPW
jgi:hypothetical protein